MKRLSEYTINFSSLKIGTHFFDYEIDNAFFNEVCFNEFSNSAFNVSITFQKQSTMLLLDFDFKGEIIVPCDRCLDDVTIKIKGKENLIVKFGEDSYNNTDDIINLPTNEHQLNIASYLNEFIQLNLPQKRVHKKKECNKEVVERLKKIEIKEPKTQNIDPRWSKLIQLKTEN